MQFRTNAVSPKPVSEFRPDAAEELDQPVSSTHNKTQSLTLYRLHFPKLYTSPMYVYERDWVGGLESLQSRSNFAPPP